MNALKPTRCPISGASEAHLVFAYETPPAGEIGFRRPAGEPYHREVWQFAPSNHFVSRHAMRVATDYDGAYVDATYGDATGMARTFERIIALPPEKSDNVGRIRRLQQFAAGYFAKGKALRLLDVG